MSFAYDADHHRIRQVTPTDQKHYLTDPFSGAKVERKLSLAGAHIQWDSYIIVQGEMVSLQVKEANDNIITRYFHRDHLSSTTMLTDEAGNVVERLSYDVWGKRRFTTGLPDGSGSIVTQVDRGFTNHEHLEEVALIHMNGRMYDPTIARFVSADPLIQDPMSTLAFNRYAYVDNNPCTYTDPTGYLKIGRIFKKIVNAVKSVFQNQIVQTVVQVAASYFGGPIGSAIASAAMTGINGGSFGDMFKAAVVAYASAQAFSAVGDATGGHYDVDTGLFHGADSMGNWVDVTTPAQYLGSANHLANMAGHAAIGCASSAAGGGKCGSGALAGAAGAAAGPKLAGAHPGAVLAAKMAIGGAASEVGGGKFWNGAKTAAFGYLHNMIGMAALSVKVPQPIKYLYEALTGKELLGTGITVGVAASIPTRPGDELDFGVFGQGEIEGYGISTGTFQAKAGLGVGSVRDMNGVGLEFSAHAQPAGMFMDLNVNNAGQITSRGSVAGVSFGVGYSASANPTMTKALTIRDGIDYVREKYFGAGQ